MVLLVIVSEGIIGMRLGCSWIYGVDGYGVERRGKVGLLMIGFAEINMSLDKKSVKRLSDARVQHSIQSVLHPQIGARMSSEDGSYWLMMTNRRSLGSL